MEKLLILGSAGFTGRCFSRFLLREQRHEHYDILCVDQVPGRTENALMRFVQSDLTDYSRMDQLIVAEKPDYIVNLIGLLGSDSVDENLKVNSFITKNIFDILHRNHVSIKKVLLVGSAAEYGIGDSLPIAEDAPLRPVTAYGLSKVVQTQIAEYNWRAFGIPMNVARTFNIIGEDLPKTLVLGHLSDLLSSARDGDEIVLGDTDTERDFLDIDDVIEAYWSILLNANPGEVFNVCSGEPVLIRELVDVLIASSRKKVVCRSVPNTSKDLRSNYGDNTKIAVALNWRPKRSVWSAASRIGRSLEAL